MAEQQDCTRQLCRQVLVDRSHRTGRSVIAYWQFGIILSSVRLSD